MSHLADRLADGRRALTADGTTTIHMVNMDRTANPLPNRSPTQDITKLPADKRTIA